MAYLPLPQMPQPVVGYRHVVGEYVRTQIPGSSLVTLPATGHCPQLSAPEATLAAIASFADGPR